MRQHPFAHINSTKARTAWFIALLLALIGAIQIMIPSNKLIVTASEANPNPQRMFDYEFAGTPSRADAIIRYWRKHGLVEHVIRNLHLDFLFLAAYSTFLAYGCFIASHTIKQKCWRQAGTVLMYGQWAAGTFDIIENFALIRMLYADIPVMPFPLVAFVMAGLKFSLIIVGLVYSVIGGLYAGYEYVSRIFAR